MAKPFVSEEKGVDDVNAAIAGAKDIIAEMISDSAELRKELREFLFRTAQIETSIKNLEKDGAKTYEMYTSHKEQVAKIPSHRILAINRGEKEDHIKVSITANDEKALEIIKNEYVKENRPFADILIETVKDSYSRLIFSKFGA